MSAPAWDGVFRRGERGRTRAGQKYRVIHLDRHGGIVVLVDGALPEWRYANGRYHAGDDVDSGHDLLPPTKPRKPKPATSEALKLAERMLAHVLAPVSIGFDAAGQEPARAPAAEPAKVALPFDDGVHRVETSGLISGERVVVMSCGSSATALTPAEARRLAAALLAAADAAEAPAPAPTPAPAEPAREPKPEPDPVTKWMDDVFTLIGHAQHLHERGDDDMPKYFFGLAERIARAHVGEAQARRVLEVQARTAP